MHTRAHILYGLASSSPALSSSSSSSTPHLSLSLRRDAWHLLVSAHHLSVYLTSQHARLCEISTWGLPLSPPPCLCKNGQFICFLSVKPWSPLVCVPMSSETDCKKKKRKERKPGQVLYLTHTTPWLTPCFFFFFPTAFTTLPEGRRSGCSLWFECPGGQRRQTESTTRHHWIGSNQAPLSNSKTEMFLALLHFRGERSSPWQRKKPGNKKPDTYKTRNCQ